MSPVQMTKLPSDSNSYECENATSHHLRNLNAKYSVYVATSHSLWFCQCISLLYFIFVDENKHPRLLLWLKQRIEQAVVWTHSGFHVLCETSCLFLLKKTFGNTDYVDECTKWMEEKKTIMVCSLLFWEALYRKDVLLHGRQLMLCRYIFRILLSVSVE